MYNLTLGNPECYTMENGEDYRGTVATTEDGETCMNWSTLSPGQRVSTETHPDKGLGEHNYCRNPDHTNGRTWCYTSHRWDRRDCDIGQPKASCIGMCYVHIIVSAK